MKNLWILTEERPKKEVLEMIFSYFAKDNGCGFFGDQIRLIPLLNENKCFDFTYEVIGFKCAKVERIYIKTVSGKSSFVDYLIFYQENEPIQNDIPIYVIEETKTDDSESRNTGVYQRCIKFVYINRFYPTAKKVMLYALQVEQKKKLSPTYIFGTRLLMTLGVDIIGKEFDDRFTPFNSIDEVIAEKREIKAHRGNVPVSIYKSDDDTIIITGRLYKDKRLAHDPNIGAISIIAAVIRKLGWEKNIVIAQHGLAQEHIKPSNKFIYITKIHDIQIDSLRLPQIELPTEYWHYEKKGEKLATIFLHIVVENFSNGFSIFENHAGCEKGYFKTSTGECLPLIKYTDKEKYKKGDKTKRVYIPDLVLLDVEEKEVITIEGKKHANRKKGIAELNNYDAFDKLYLQKHYATFKIIRTVVLYGSSNGEIYEVEVGFLLNAKGRLCLGVNAPSLFRRAINNLLDYWS